MLVVIVSESSDAIPRDLERLQNVALERLRRYR